MKKLIIIIFTSIFISCGNGGTENIEKFSDKYNGSEFKGLTDYERYYQHSTDYIYVIIDGKCYKKFWYYVSRGNYIPCYTPVSGCMCGLNEKD